MVKTFMVTGVIVSLGHFADKAVQGAIRAHELN